MKTTNVELVEELSLRNTNRRYDSIIERAKNNGYHCFKFDTNPKYSDCLCPKTELCEHLSAFPELDDIRSEVMNGNYDESPDADDKAMMRGWLSNDGDKGERLMDVLGLNENDKK